MPGKGGREPVMAEAEDGKNGQEGQGGQPDPIDYKAKYEAMKTHSREWERKAKENQGAADELEKLKAENLSELEKAQQRAKAAEDEAARLKADQERAAAVSGVADEANVPVEGRRRAFGAGKARARNPTGVPHEDGRRRHGRCREEKEGQGRQVL